MIPHYGGNETIGKSQQALALSNTRAATVF
jgi:hypothetical protein